MEHGIQWAWNYINTSTVLKNKINFLSKNIYVDKTCMKIDYMSKTAYDEQQVFPLSSTCFNPGFLIESVLLILFFCARLRFALISLLSFWLHAQCCMFLQIVNLWFLVRFSLTFIYIYIYIYINTRQYILCNNQKHIFPTVHIRVVFILICFVKGLWFIYVIYIFHTSSTQTDTTLISNMYGSLFIISFYIIYLFISLITALFVVWYIHCCIYICIMFSRRLT